MKFGLKGLQQLMQYHQKIRFQLCDAVLSTQRTRVPTPVGRVLLYKYCMEQICSPPK